MKPRLPLILLVSTSFATAILNGEEPGSKEDPGFVVFRDNCIACHLPSGMGIREMNAPSIAGLPRWYITDQLRKFRREERGFHDEDVSGALMRANAEVLDERSIAFVGRYIESLEANQARNTSNLVLTEDSKGLYQCKCSNCHGEGADGNRKDRVPPLTSQQDWYLLRQIQNFKSGQRMHVEGSPLKDLPEQRIQAIIAWITQLPSAE